MSFNFDITKLRLNRLPYQILVKSGLKADINTTVTKARALEGEPHYATDTKEFFVFDGTDNIPVAPRGYTGVSATYTILSTDYTIDCTANTFTVTLPTAVGITGQIYNIKNSGTGTITVDGDGTETIDGDTSIDIVTQYDSRTFQSNGANWIEL